MRAHICGISKAEVRGGVRAIMLCSSLDMSAEKAKKRYQQGKWPAWEHVAGSQFKYLMVFEKYPLKEDGAYNFSDFSRIIQEL